MKDSQDNMQATISANQEKTEAGQYLKRTEMEAGQEMMTVTTNVNQEKMDSAISVFRRSETEFEEATSKRVDAHREGI
jgi:hypothetical protein